MSWFSFLGSSSTDTELPEIFPFSYSKVNFVRADVQSIYAKILTDVFERTQGLPEKVEGLLWDNCLASEASDGLITLLAKAMTDKAELFVVYDPALDLIRKATGPEQSKIREDYKTNNKSTIGIYVTFKNYTRTDMVKLYSELEYCSVVALDKTMNLSKAIQLKLTDLRSSVGLSDKADAVKQASAMATGLAQGKDIMLDAKDMIETAKPDLTATQSAMDFIAQKRSFYLGMPASYITGSQSKGLGDSGVGDAKAIERGLKNYFFSVVKPVAQDLFDATLEFESEDYEQLSTSLEALKTFELTSDELISQDNKRTIVNRLFGLPEDEKGDAPKVVVPPVKPVPGNGSAGGVPNGSAQG